MQPTPHSTLVTPAPPYRYSEGTWPSTPLIHSLDPRSLPLASSGRLLSLHSTRCPLATIILVESAIDAISCFALYPQHRCISTAGSRPNPRWLAPLIGQGYRVYCGFDADPTGEAMAHAMIALHPTLQRLRPTRHDWNDVLKARA